MPASPASASGKACPKAASGKAYEFTDNFTLIKGAHNFKFGGQYYYLQADSVFDALARPVFQFASFAAFGTGTPAVYQQRIGNSNRNNRVNNIFSYVQDDWKVSRNLTVNLGLRMEFAGGPTEVDGRISNLNLNNNAAYGAAGGGPFGLMESGKPSFQSNYNWGPRLGFAWTPFGDQRTVIRGGYGVAYDFIFLNPITNQRFLPPLMITASLTGGGITGANSFAALAGGTGPDPARNPRPGRQPLPDCAATSAPSRRPLTRTCAIPRSTNSTSASSANSSAASS